MPLVSVVVVNYNGAASIAKALLGLLADGHPSRELLVVDNASTDDSRPILERLAAANGALDVVWSEHNLGYAGGVNLALDRARGTYLVVLNMDIEVGPGWLEPLVAFLEQRPDVGAVSPLLVLADGQRVNAIGQDIHVTALGFNCGLNLPVKEVPPDPIAVSGIQGAAFAIRRELLAQLGGMDSTGFLYHEDVNLSWLLRLTGHELFCIPTSRVRHDYFLSMYPEKFHLLERNRLALLFTFLGWPSLLLLSPLIALTEAMAWAYATLRGPRFLGAKGRGYAWLGRHARALKTRRRWLKTVRTVSDWRVLRRLRFAYNWRQFVTLGRERGISERQPVGGMPTDAERRALRRKEG